MLERHSDESQQSRPYPPRRRRPEHPSEPTTPSSGGGAGKWFAVIGAVLILLIVLGRLRSTPEPAPVAAPVDSQPEVQVSTPRPVPSPLPAPPAAPAGATPTVDLLVRLEAHRQVVRAGSAVYLDSLLAESDSILRRWPGTTGESITIAVVPDSLADRAGTAGQEALRDAFGLWSAFQLGLRFGFVGDTTTANIIVEWIPRFEAEERKSGQTDLTVGSDGTIQSARIRLALADPAGKTLDRPALLALALHEAGHALGLGHSSQTGDVMYPTPRLAKLSNRDRATAELIYGLPPGSVKGGN
jgi:Matrixin